MPIARPASFRIGDPDIPGSVGSMESKAPPIVNFSSTFVRTHRPGIDRTHPLQVRALPIPTDTFSVKSSYVVTNFADVWRFLRFIAGFGDHIDSCRIIRDGS